MLYYNCNKEILKIQKGEIDMLSIIKRKKKVTKEDCVKAYNEKWNVCLQEVTKKSKNVTITELNNSAYDLFKKELSPIEFVGLFIVMYGEQAYKKWMACKRHFNCKKSDMTDMEIEAETLLKSVCCQ